MGGGEAAMLSKRIVNGPSPESLKMARRLTTGCVGDADAQSRATATGSHVEEGHEEEEEAEEEEEDDDDDDEEDGSVGGSCAEESLI